jgi:hypothetical protein
VNFFPIGGLKAFYLVILIGRCKYKLSKKTVSSILQATLGGVVADFRPKELSARVFMFTVASREVGFHIYSLKSFSSDQYQIWFHVWGNGGPHWISEYQKFLQEQASEWTLVSRSHSRKSQSYADIVKNSVLSGANKIPLGFQNSHRIPHSGHSSDNHHRQLKTKIDPRKVLHSDYNLEKSSVFHHLEWPRHHDHVREKSSDHSRSKRFQVWRRKERALPIQNSNVADKGKRPIALEASLSGPLCTMLRRALSSPSTTDQFVPAVKAWAMC